MNALTSTVGKVIATRLSSVLYPLEIQLMGGLPVWLLFCVLVPGHGRVVLLVLPAGCLLGDIDPFGLKFTPTAREFRGASRKPGIRVRRGDNQIVTPLAASVCQQPACKLVGKSRQGESQSSPP
jgi:hypothetical protein